MHSQELQRELTAAKPSKHGCNGVYYTDCKRCVSVSYILFKNPKCLLFSWDFCCFHYPSERIWYHTKVKQRETSLISFFPLFLIIWSPCCSFFFFLHQHPWDLTLFPIQASIPEAPQPPRQTPSHSFTFTRGGKAYRVATKGLRGKEGVQQHQQPQNRRMSLSVCSTSCTYMSLIYY